MLFEFILITNGTICTYLYRCHMYIYVHVCVCRDGCRGQRLTSFHLQWLSISFYEADSESAACHSAGLLASKLQRSPPQHSDGKHTPCTQRLCSGSGNWTHIFRLFSCLGHSLFRSLGGTVHGHWSGCLDHYASENNGRVTDMRHGYNLPTSCPSNLARLQDQQRTLHQTLICNSQELPDTKWADAKTSRWGRKINKL